MIKKRDRYKARHDWYFGEAQTLVRELQGVLWPVQWHVAMGGGVLNHGYSDSDLDLYILPLNKTAKFDDAETAIRTVLTYKQEISGNPRYRSMAPAIEGADIYDYNDKRVDVFIFRPHCDVCHVADLLLDK